MQINSSSLIVETLPKEEGAASVSAVKDSSPKAPCMALIPYVAAETLIAPSTAPRVAVPPLKSSTLINQIASCLTDNECLVLSNVCSLFQRTLMKQPNDLLPLHVRWQLPYRIMSPLLLRGLATQFNVDPALIGEHGRQLSIFRYADLETTLPALKNLRILNMGSPNYQPDSITETSVELITTHCPDLVQFNCSHSSLTDEMLKKLAATLLKVDHLSIPDSEEVTDEGVLAFINSRKLRHLNVSVCPNITDATLVALAENASQLESLSLAGYRTDDESGLKTLFAQCKELREISLCNVDFDEETFIPLFENAPKLRKICLNYSTISDRALKVLAEKCPLLEELEIAGCKNLTDASLTSLNQHKSLRTLDISSNGSRMTSAVVDVFCGANRRIHVKKGLMA